MRRYILSRSNLPGLAFALTFLLAPLALAPSLAAADGGRGDFSHNHLCHLRQQIV